MYDKFGELDSVKEINELAENLFNEGDFDSIRALAKENGIPEEFVDAYLNGETEVLSDAMTAADGKLEVEAEALKPNGIMKDWLDYIRAMSMDNELFCHQIRKKGKSLTGCIGVLLKWSFRNQQQVPDAVIKAADIKASKVTMGIPDMGTAKKLIREYYLEG